MNPVAVSKDGTHDGVTTSYLKLWCPACDDLHMITTARSDGTSTWTWDGNTERPTISPSILVNAGGGNPQHPTCHSFVRDGQWEFLSDCTHALAGQTVPMVPVPDWLMEA